MLVTLPPHVMLVSESLDALYATLRLGGLLALLFPVVVKDACIWFIVLGPALSCGIRRVERKQQLDACSWILFCP